MTFAWTDHADAELRRCINERLSATQTATAMGAASKSVVMGRAFRLGLRFMSQPPGAIRRKRPKRRGPPAWHEASHAEAASAKPVEPPRAIPDAPNSRPVDLMGLTDRTCRWPLWEGDEPRLFCGALEADMKEGVVYCPYHAAAAIGRPYTRQERFEFRKGRGA